MCVVCVCVCFNTILYTNRSDDQMSSKNIYIANFIQKSYQKWSTQFGMCELWIRVQLKMYRVSNI